MRRTRGLALLLAFGLVAAACGDDDGGGEAEDTATSAAGGGTATSAGAATTSGGDDVEIDREATLRLAWTGPATQLDPHKERHSGERPYLFLLYDRLTYVDINQDVQPMLATEWEFSPDGTTLTMTLRDDATFHDGTPVDAAAVKASIERGKTLQGSTVARYLTKVDSVDAVDATTVRFNLNGPASNLPYLLSMMPGAVINPKVIASGEDIGFGHPTAGSGPYVVADFKPNDRALFERATDPYWDESANHFKTIEQIWISESQTRMGALRAGQVNSIIVKQDQADEAKQVAEAGDHEFFQYPGLLHYALELRNTRPPFDQPEVRQALAHAIDKQAIADQLLGGNCDVTAQPWPEGHWAHNDAFEDPYPYDPDRARELLADAGLSGGFSFEAIQNAGLSPQLEIGQVIQAQLAELDVNMTITPISSAEAGLTFQKGDRDAYNMLITGEVDPSVTLELYMLENSAFKLAGPDVGMIAPLAEQALDPSLSREERGEIYAEIGQIMGEQLWYIPICFQPTMFLFPAGIVNAETMSWGWAGIFDLRYLGMAAS